MHRYLVLLGIFLRATNGFNNPWFIPSCDCTDVVNEACGTDGKTYQNQCSLVCASFSKPGLTVAHLGACSYERTCSCSRKWKPVCGSDGLTYENGCFLTCAAYASMDNGLHVAQEGVCPSRRKMPQEQENEMDQDGVEPESSSQEIAEAQVIGLPCSIYVIEGTVCNKTRCDEDEPGPLCGNDGTTYLNRCEFCCVYMKERNVKILRRGECNATRPNETDATSTTTPTAVWSTTKKSKSR